MGKENFRNVDIEKNARNDLGTQNTYWGSVEECKRGTNKLRAIKKRENCLGYCVHRNCVLKNAVKSIIKDRRGSGRRRMHILDSINEDRSLRQKGRSEDRVNGDRLKDL